MSGTVEVRKARAAEGGWRSPVPDLEIPRTPSDVPQPPLVLLAQHVSQSLDVIAVVAKLADASKNKITIKFHEIPKG